ncbi:hypothetical protein [Streptomyces sp. NPDC058299]|uniref:hypothetical protein n=1 Tax=unclassified Streptomyces TaxID=2593676 RepID=UPI0036F0E888
MTFQPALYYDVGARDDNEACENFGKTFEVNPCYSNGGKVVVQCGLCRHNMTIVSGTLLDPQPEVS